MYITRAIKQAVTQGFTCRGERILYDNLYDSFYINDGDGGFAHLCYDEILLDPEFWRCLGESLGWEEGGWLYHWHRYIDHIAEGRNTEEFFENLLHPTHPSDCPKDGMLLMRQVTKEQLEKYFISVIKKLKKL